MYIRSLLTLVAGAWLAAATSTERNPLRSTGRIADPSIQTSTHRANSLSSFNLDFDLPDVSRRIRLSLEPNHDVIPEGARVTHLNADGTTKKRRPIERHEHKIYKGVARSRRDDGTWSQVGTARISLRRDGLEPLFEGTFSVNHDHHHILSRSSYVRTKQALDPEVEKAGQEFMVYFRDSDMVSPRLLASEYNTELKRDVDGHTCYANELSSNWNSLTGTFSAQESNLNSGYGAVLGKRQSQIDTQPGSGNTGGVDLSSTIGQTAGCPSTRKVALVGVATDCGYTSQFDDEDAVHQNIVSVMNSASGVFESAFNISLGLKDITVLDAECPGTPNAATPWNQGCSDSVDIQQRLNLFSTWRNTLNDNNSHWTLLTKCNTGTAVGLAWVGRACMSPSQGSQVQSASNETVAGANVVALTGTEWQVVAHETGHTFGAVHDCDSSACQNQQYVASGQCCPYMQNACDAGSQFIMNPFSTSGITDFSPCSIGNICSAIGKNAVNTQCLSDNRAVQTVTEPQCGNGIVEEGENCDCGGPEACASDSCCDPNTCKFTAGSVCDDANEDCCSSCQFASAGSVCRASTSPCDPQETCAGSSAACPPDVTSPDGQSCSIPEVPAHAGDLTCASGQCTSRNLQCMSVMGSYTRGSNDTYACDDSACTLSCGSPAFGPNVCYQMQQNLLDGTSCGGGGKCASGVCQGSDFTQEVGNWIDDHKEIVIGIAVAVGCLVLFAMLSCCCGCIKRSRRRKAAGKMVGHSPDGSWHGPPPPVPVHQQFPMQQRGQPPPGYAAGSGPGGWGHDSPQQGWRPRTPQQTSPGQRELPWSGQGLYGNGILGSNGPQPNYFPPQQPPPAYWGGGGGSARYA